MKKTLLIFAILAFVMNYGFSQDWSSVQLADNQSDAGGFASTTGETDLINRTFSQ